MRKPAFCIWEIKDAHQWFSAFVFATRTVQSLYFLNLKFQASSHLLWPHSPVCVGPGWKPRKPVFSQRGPYVNISSLSHLFLLVFHDLSLIGDLLYTVFIHKLVFF